MRRRQQPLCSRASLFAVSAVIALSAGASAAVAADVGFQVNQPLIVTESAKSKTKPDGGSETTVKESDVETMPSALEVVASFSGLHVHFFPTDPEQPLGLGYDVIEGLEVGINLGLDSSKVDKPKDEKAQAVFGIFGVYNVQLGAPVLEVGLGLAALSDKTEETDATGAKTKTNTKGSSATLGATLVVPVKGGISYLAALAGTSEKTEEKEAKVKDTRQTLAVSPLGLRIEL